MKRKTAKRRIIVTDQGNGGQYCSNCKAATRWKDEHCPKCGLYLEWSDDIGGDFGNHDNSRF
jgi:predicted amidophosphoribosyltransferase